MDMQMPPALARRLEIANRDGRYLGGNMIVRGITVPYKPLVMEDGRIDEYRLEVAYRAVQKLTYGSVGRMRTPAEESQLAWLVAAFRDADRYADIVHMLDLDREYIGT